jgi:hypothetical protein
MAALMMREMAAVMISRFFIMAREKKEMIVQDNKELKLGSHADKPLKYRMIGGLSTWSDGRLTSTSWRGLMIR